MSIALIHTKIILLHKTLVISFFYGTDIIFYYERNNLTIIKTHTLIGVHLMQDRLKPIVLI